MSVNLEFFQNLFFSKLSNVGNSLDITIPDDFKGDDVDMSMMNSELEMQTRLLGREAYYSKKIKEALMRINEGTYGVCDECGEEISFNRLLARPTATTCVSCKEDLEREEGHVLYKKRSHTLGTAILVR